MSESHPGLTVDVREGWSPELDSALLADDYDIVLSRDIPRRPEYRRETLRHERVVAVVDERHPLVHRGQVGLREFAGQRFCHPPRRLAPDRHDFMVSALERTGETFEYWESPVHGLGHLDLHDRRSFALVAASVVGRVPVGTATIALTDDLPPLDLQMVWKQGNSSTALTILIDTAREVARAGTIQPESELAPAVAPLPSCARCRRMWRRRVRTGASRHWTCRSAFAFFAQGRQTFSTVDLHGAPRGGHVLSPHEIARRRTAGTTTDQPSSGSSQSLTTRAVAAAKSSISV